MVGFNRLPNELLWMVYENIDGIRDAPGRLCTDSRCLTGIDYFSNVAALTLLNRRCRDIFKPALFHCCGSVYAIRWAVQNKRIDVLQATLRHAGTPEVKRDLVNREAYICLEPVAFRHPPRERAVKWPLELACSRGYDDIVSLLLDAGADAAATSSRTISNPRHWYCLCMYSGMRQDNYQKMNPLRRAICSSHSSTALLLLQRNAPFPSVFQVSSGIYYPNVLHSAMAHGDVVLVDFLLRQLPDRVEEEQNRTYWPSCLSPLVKCGDHDAVRAIANLIMQNPVIQARSRQSKGESCHNAAVLAISCRNWATACALLETSPVALPADLTRECLMSRAQYDDSWTQQYQEFWPHFYGWGYDSEWDDQIRGSSESTPYMCYGGWITQPRDVRHWHIWRAKLVGKLLHTLNPSSPLGESSLVHFPLGRIPRRELDILLPVKATFTSLQWAIISEDILTLRTVIQTGPQQDLMPLEAIWHRHDKIVKEILANTPPSSIKDAAIFSVLPIIKQCKQPNSGPWAARTSEFESGYRQQLHMETLAVRSIGLETPPHQLLFDIFEEAVKQFLLAPALAPARQHRTQHLLGLLTELISLGADVNQGIQGCCSSSRYLACNPPTRFCRSLAAQLNAYIHENRNLCYLINGYALFNLPLEHFKVVRWRLPQLANILRRTFTVVPASGSEGMSSASETATHQVVCHPEHVINPAAFLASQAGPDDEVGICDEVYLGVRLYGWTTARHFEAQSLSDIDTELRLSEGGLLHGHHQLAL
ncbi:hypothetical protein QBC40DRAFT_333230 [Triangularia verruculosa]|uniref:Uncharacterized protein n=1 Tax=Triangularia verruculosa TaxID=2587418 RepID=A0AAN6XDR8_9PEZI|nr:hypothetical protein QBC40DRAFT_333230 [Triangularia verruculosa]